MKVRRPALAAVAVAFGALSFVVGGAAGAPGDTAAPITVGGPHNLPSPLGTKQFAEEAGRPRR